ncbi:hypothetical protein [Stenotrophomonas phage vB_SmaS_P15]|uniref:Uncharacterized protein n=1 Tax=Stenotrophomonas phage vB_SmaS_P15 TaxID=2894592 RepID=A0AAE9C6U3_9CAUD|nr:hypothetical protein [Stenotrophomonas phage vB_SmaS_P15]
MHIELTDFIVRQWDTWEDRKVHVMYEVRAVTEDGTFSEQFTVSHCPMRGQDNKRKQLHYHMNVARNRVTRRAIEKRYGD